MSDNDLSLIVAFYKKPTCFYCLQKYSGHKERFSLWPLYLQG